MLIIWRVSLFQFILTIIREQLIAVKFIILRHTWVVWVFLFYLSSDMSSAKSNNLLWPWWGVVRFAVVKFLTLYSSQLEDDRM